ncbi:hypothetical protein ACHWQZ_G015152 [Mnemiopsis leidyi]
MTPFNYSDTKYGIHSTTERYAWSAYFLFALLSSLIGDTLILAASSQRSAFKVNKLIVRVIQHIAVSDIASAVTTVLPALVSMVTNSWVLGEPLCLITAYTGYITYQAGTYLIAVLTTIKFLILKYPVRAATWTTKRAQQICSLTWASSFIVVFLQMVMKKGDEYFDYRRYGCSRGSITGPWKKAVAITASIFAFTPNVIIVVITVPTLRFVVEARRSARRVHGHVPRQGAVTVVLTALIYCISIVPISVYQIVTVFIKEDGGSHVEYYRMGCFFLMINIMANFYIYTLTIKTFRRYILVRVRLMTKCFSVSNKTSPAGDDLKGNGVDKSTSQTVNNDTSL